MRRCADCGEAIPNDQKLCNCNTSGDIGIPSDSNHCDSCGEELICTRKAEYPGGMPWEYYYCCNPKCPMYKKEQ